MINLLETFFTDYSISTLIVSFVALIIVTVIEGIMKENFNSFKKTYAVFIISVILQVAYDVIFIAESFRLESEAVLAGAVSGSLSLALSSFIKRILQGKGLPSSVEGLLIEELIKDYVDVEKITETAMYIESLINNEKDDMLESKISLVIIENSINGISQSQALRIAKNIIECEENLN